MTKTVTATVTRRFHHPVEAVFDAWIDPVLAAWWLFRTPGGENIVCEIDAREGGGFTITDRRRREDGDGFEDVEHIGVYEVIDRPRRLKFHFSVTRYSQAADPVEIVIEPDGDGCILTLTHSMQESPYSHRAQEGWTMLMGEMEKVLDAA